MKDQSDPFEYINESSDQADGQKDQNNSSQSGDIHTTDDHNQLSRSADRHESTNEYSTMSADGQGHGAESVSCKMLLGEASRSDTLEKFVESVQNDRVISDKEWLETFGITEHQLRDILEPVAKNIIELFYFLNTGKLLSKDTTGCPREPCPLCFWVTVFNIFTLWSPHAIHMKTDIKRNATSTQSLLTEQ